LIEIYMKAIGMVEADKKGSQDPKDIQIGSA